ncbi:hypothetical protein HGRIS_008049 [Hohenbuehelia grisea]|uniref:Pentatricopeptide repeat-containing protein n=1 Tax=Hohenbuehelia grisea TaxID=104357 RepID=A0ABR3J774_9AGAR
MLPRVSGARILVLPDFLAPGLIRRSSGTPRGYSPKNPASKLPSRLTLPSVDFEQLKERITSFHGEGGSRQLGASNDVFNHTTLNIRDALQNKDVNALAEHWKYLQRNNLLRFLGPSQLGLISSLLKGFCPVEDPDVPWKEDNRNIVEEIALTIAVARQPDALIACLHAHIRRGDAAATLSLYQRFFELVKEQDVIDAEKKPEMETNDTESALGYDALASAPMTTVETTPYFPGRGAILLAAITAHALRDDFLGALDTCIATTYRLHPPAVEMFLRKILYDQELHNRVTSYADRLRVGVFVAHPIELSKRVNALTQMGAIRPLEKLYQAVINAVSGPDPFIAANESQRSTDKPVFLTETVWTSFLTAFLKLNRKDLATKLWDDMIALGLRPGVTTWTAYIDACNSAGLYEHAVTGWTMMLQSNVKPELLTYRALIGTYFNARRPDKAKQAFEAFEKEYMSEARIGDTANHVLLYNTVLHGLLTNGMSSEASELLHQMHEKGPPPDIVSYNTILRYWSREGDFKKLASIVGEMSAVGIQGDVFTYSTILSALLRTGRADAPDIVFNLMRKNGVTPNVAIYSAIMHHQLQQQNIESLRAAMSLLQKMELDPDAQPNEVTYTSFLAGLHRGSWLPQPIAEDWRQNIVGRMRRRKIVPNRVTYHILLKACLENPAPEGLQHALQHLEDMQKEKITPTSKTWYILLSGLLHRQDWAVADELVKNMYSTGFQPLGSLYELVGRIRRREVFASPRSRNHHW